MALALAGYPKAYGLLEPWMGMSDMVPRERLEPGDPWPEHYRGFRLHVNSDEEVWWEPYRGTGRLFLDDIPKNLLQALFDVKSLGGRIHITEAGDVLTRVEEEDGYVGVWLGEWRAEGELVPREDPDFSINLRPTGLSPGDLWPSVYDGACYSYAGQRAWWQNAETMRRHPVEAGLPSPILDKLRKFKHKGGSFRVTPWGDVVTLVPTLPRRDKLREQFNALPRVVKNIIKLRKERGLEMLPIYIGTIEDCRIDVSEPRGLTDPLSDEEVDELERWAETLGQTEPLDPGEHSANNPDRDPEEKETGSGWGDDPQDWST